MGRRSGADGLRSRCRAVACAASMTGKANRSLAGALRGERRVTRDRTQEVLMRQQTQVQTAVDKHDVGRFSEGIERLPDTPSKLHRGRFSEGIETLPNTRSKLRRAASARGSSSCPRRRASSVAGASPPDSTRSGNAQSHVVDGSVRSGCDRCTATMTPRAPRGRPSCSNSHHDRAGGVLFGVRRPKCWGPLQISAAGS
jgi:hypothetical protein